MRFGSYVVLGNKNEPEWLYPTILAHISVTVKYGVILSPGYNLYMKKVLTWLSRRRHPYEPLITVEISKSRLLHNLNEFRKIAPGGHIAPVLKSNAYGHGLIEVASILEEERRKSRASSGHAIMPFFVVDSYFEAVALRARRLRTPLLVIGYTRSETMLASRLRDVSFTIGNIASLRDIKEADRDIRIQIKIDTGMHRQGILPEEIDEAISIVELNPYLVLEGICSHFADADNPDLTYTEEQSALWHKVLTRFKHAFPTLRHFHVSNTDGHRVSATVDANVSRLGLGLYGLADGSLFKPPLNLQPVMEVKSVITGTKKILRGGTIGYSRTFTAETDMTIATIPFGYYEGFDRRLSNKGSVLLGPERIPCPLVGRVSMNISTADVTKAQACTPGTSVILISNSTRDPNSAENLAKLCGTISYEMIVHIPAHLKRIIV